MPLAVRCPSCSTTLKVSEKLAGKQGKCPKCASVVTVPAEAGAAIKLTASPPNAQPAQAPSANRPAQAPSASAHAPQTVPSPPQRTVAATTPAATKPNSTAQSLPSLEEQRTAKLLAAIQGKIHPVRPSLLYLLSAILVSCAIVVLPIVYICLTAAVGAATVWHAVYSTRLFSSMPIRIAIFVYLTPLFAGVVLLAVMIKPLFARPTGFHRSRSLTPFAEPRLFAFVEKLCAAVGAPMPRRIDIDADVNASASLRRGGLSLFSDDLVLTIGIPLVACLNIREFAGVLAHEFGHFSQRGAMRLGYFVNKVNGWFVRAVYERDSWDLFLTDTADDAHFSVQIACGLAALCVAITRGILWLFMVASVLISRLLLREQEFHADLHEIRFSGSESFMETMKRIHLIGAANQEVMKDLIMRLQSGSLPDSFPKLVQKTLQELPRKTTNRVLSDLESGKTQFLDTHPSAKARMARAERAAAPGIFHLEVPATVLLSNFPASAQNVTLDIYRDIFGPRFNPNCLVDSDQLASE